MTDTIILQPENNIIAFSSALSPDIKILQDEFHVSLNLRQTEIRIEEENPTVRFYSTGIQGPPGEGGAGEVYTTRTEQTSLYIYCGEALPGADEADPVWKVKRYNKTTLVVLWADGNSDLDNVWNDYLSLSYS